MNQSNNPHLAAAAALGLALAALQAGAGETPSTQIGANPAGSGAGDPAARFRGAPTYDFGVTNVKWEAGTRDYSFVTFDVSWGHSWRAKWTEPAEKTVTGKPLDVESWDAVWLFVKYLPEKDSKTSVERNHWQHATLDTDAAHHVVPAGATNTVGLTGDGKRGLGVYVHRAAVGCGPVNFKGVKLRWLHAADPSTGLGAGKVDPTKAAVRVFEVAMVYVPEGPFAAGDGSEPGVTGFLDGPTLPLRNGGPGPIGCITDGSWRGGAVVPFVVDAEWNGPADSSPRARRIEPRSGRLWGTLTYCERMAAGCSVGQPGVLNDDYPTGYDAFYIMKYPLTQGQYAGFLNSLPPEVAAARAFVSGDADDPEGGTEGKEVKIDRGRGRPPLTIKVQSGYTIYSSADLPPESPTAPDAGGGLDGGTDGGLDELITDPKDKLTMPPVYTAWLPFRRCNWLSSWDVFSYAAWAGLRPFTELELIKACRGPRHPAPRERVWGTSSRSGQLKAVNPLEEGQPTERFVPGTVPHDRSAFRVGNLATAESNRELARASYWGILDLEGAQVVPVNAPEHRAFRGTPGDGRSPAGTPGASLKRSRGPVFDTVPADWPNPTHCGNKIGGHDPVGPLIEERSWVSGEHMGPSRKAGNICRLAGPIRVPVTPRAGSDPKASARVAEPATAQNVAPADTVRVTNVKCEPGADWSTITFDLAWDNSWRAKWTEPAEKNVSGKPLEVESWDAAWVFVKVRPPGAAEDTHAMLAAQAGDHQVPAGAAIEVGLDDEGEKGLGVLVCRSAAGKGPVAFKKIGLRWLHGGDPSTPRRAGQAPDKDAKIQVHAVEVVYVPSGPFKSKDIRGGPLTLIATGDATKPGGYMSTNAVPINAAWPNGFTAYYFMKHPISQGQYAAFLSSAAADLKAVQYNNSRYSAIGNNNAWRYAGDMVGVNGYGIKRNADGTYAADAPGRAANFLSWPDIESYAAWAGLRPPTDLEYEKACRGPREVKTDSDAWTAATCAPAAGLGIAGGRVYGDYGPSYWGIRGLSLSGCIQEWPGVIYSFNRAYSGSHGHGSPWAPEDWPWSAVGECIAGGIWEGLQPVGIWVAPSQLGATYPRWETVDMDRSGRFGARAVRTAPAKREANSPMQVDKLPELSGADVVVFALAGRFRNDDAAALKVEVATGLPATCFPEGAAFTATPKAVTPFKILMALTPALAAGGVQGAGWLTIRLQGPGGAALAEGRVRVAMDDPKRREPQVVGSLAGGKLTMRIRNASDRPLPVTLDLTPPAGVKVDRTEQRLEAAAGATALAVFTVPRQAFGVAGICELPVRVTIAGGAPCAASIVANLQPQSRWWLTRRVHAGPTMDDGPRAGDELDLTGMASPAGDVFKATEPPQDWRSAVCDPTVDPKHLAVSGSRVPLATVGALASEGSVALAGTRARALAERQAVVAIQAAPAAAAVPAKCQVRVWVNDEVVLELPPGLEVKATVKPFRLRQGSNTVLVEARSKEAAAATLDDVILRVLEAKDGQPVGGLLFDMDARR